MAYKVTQQGLALGRGGKGAFAFYLVDQAVGHGRANLRDDVLLVQYLLKKLSFYQMMAAPNSPQKPLHLH